MVRVLNELGCEGLVVGNHEFNFGWPTIEALRRDARFPLLAANVLGPGGEPFFEPCLRLERNRRRIAILALTSPQVPRWEEPEHYDGLTFRDAVETAREWVPRLRKEADAVVIAAHMGWDGVTDGGTEIPDPPENDVGRLLEEVEGIDVVLMGHTHRVDERRENGALAVQADWGGRAVGEVELVWPAEGPGNDGRPATFYRMHRVVEQTPEAPSVISLVCRDEERTAVRMREVIGEATAPFPLEDVRYRDNAVLTLLHRVQLAAADVELSSAALFRANETLAPGPIRLLDTFRIYPFENDLTLLELTVDDVRDYLEQIALTYVGPAGDGERPPIDPRISLYNHDSLAGVEYVLDPGLPPGRRVTRMTFRGEELPGDRRLSLAISSYRAQGGGGYRALRRARVVERTGRESRRLLEEFIRDQVRIDPVVFDNWRVEGLGTP
jgi:2',3'-cyclic-nucleotide 2'-phosphodiesterase/3'-nucleotidase